MQAIFTAARHFENWHFFVDVCDKTPNFDNFLDPLRHFGIWWNSHRYKTCMPSVYTKIFKALCGKLTVLRHSERRHVLSANSLSSGLTVPRTFHIPGLNVQSKSCFTVLTEMTWKTCGALWRLSSLGVDSGYQGTAALLQSSLCFFSRICSDFWWSSDIRFAHFWLSNLHKIW